MSATQMQLGDVAVSIEDGIATLTLDRRPHNAITTETAVALAEFFRSAAERSDVRVVLLTAAGPIFCAGADIGDMSGIAERTTLDYRNGYTAHTKLFEAMWETEVPVISAVGGKVAGIGWMLALLADLVVADQDVRWTHTFTRRGMVPHAGDPYFLTRLIPFRRLMEISLLSDGVSGSTLEEWGIVNRAVPADAVVATARELAERLAVGPTRSLGMTKQLYRRALDLPIQAALTDERASVALIATTHDRAEGLAAFVEGRPPVFLGR
ncbi:enoyl-CoA hydratase/isomerase family protein [Microbacterium immunditiarum]|uniref:2-(1,2-epoxy-1,2-dihydrophenyl)acetyl-CoA isomerase n=1 Tax=Microbacterium immunditiarum TaxID=337480 RepID=A0A7Y9KLE5_9MICO|nr:enoyl-CoA hydratase-related protein [Microbacterium immunditiarum]NYE19659.1 2-(1,2-epoxy-1,2-dihydrophenyl)acetyl-CoA isomerase [Microbacterium immunditiarum]